MATSKAIARYDDSEWSQMYGMMNLGMSVEDAALASDMAPRVVLSIMERGMVIDRDGINAKNAKDRFAYESFMKARKARSTAVRRALENISRSDDWKASKWILETLDPNRFSKQYDSTPLVEQSSVTQIEA